jgi:hypothetical protein
VVPVVVFVVAVLAVLAVISRQHHLLLVQLLL